MRTIVPAGVDSRMIAEGRKGVKRQPAGPYSSMAEYLAASCLGVATVQTASGNGT
jgi:hypothetical protein